MHAAQLTPYQKWSILIGASVMLSLSMGMRQSFGLFQPAILHEVWAVQFGEHVVRTTRSTGNDSSVADPTCGLASATAVTPAAPVAAPPIRSFRRLNAESATSDHLWVGWARKH